MKSLNLGGLALILLGSAVAPGFAADPVTLTYYIDDNPTNVATAEGLKAAFEAENPDIKIEIETHPGGGEGDNLVKTRLATGDMPDVFRYNAGSLFRALNPPETMLDLTNEPYNANVIDSFKPVVSVDGKIYGVPEEAAMGGGILYNKKIYADLGLSVPKSWAEFMANNEKIKAAGKVPVIQTFGDTWTSQLFVLADYYNVQAAVPDFAEKYTANQAKYATTPAAMKGFERQEEVFKAGYLNEDFAAAKFDDGMRMVATGEGAHYPMLTFAIGGIAQNYADNLKDVGFFAMPGDDAGVERPDGLDAGRRLHRQDHRASRGGQALRGLRRQHQGLRRAQRCQRRHRPLPDQGLHAARETCRRPLPTCCPTSSRTGQPRRRSSSCRRSRARRSSRSRSKSARASARPPTAPRSMTRT